ncbi:MAG TPA: hypothetical protein VM261_00485 [Kofleriaceae bacterium]|nr:hypothetical protein [Kofleriaceae bacterium]
MPVAVDDEDTRPVDAEQLEVAARRSTELVDPSAAESLPTMRPAANAVPRPFVELQVAGAGTVVRLPIHRVSAMGVVLTVPPGVRVDLAHDTAVTAVVHLMRNDEELTRARVPAHVSHHRMASPDANGGLSLRWDLREASARTAVEALLAGAG